MLCTSLIIVWALQLQGGGRNKNHSVTSRRTFVSSSILVGSLSSGAVVAVAAPGQLASSPVFTIDVLETPADSCNIKSRRNDLLEFNYEARIGDKNGRIYDASEIRGTGQPYAYVLGSGDLIPGVDQGLYDMCPGEVRALTIPPSIGYGPRGVNLFDIPPYTNIWWKVELVAVNFARQGDKRTREEIDGGY
jgi:hypothetical protein